MNQFLPLSALLGQGSGAELLGPAHTIFSSLCPTPPSLTPLFRAGPCGQEGGGRAHRDQLLTRNLGQQPPLRPQLSLRDTRLRLRVKDRVGDSLV